MIHLFVNASAASAGGGLTYIRNLVPEIEKRRDLRATLLLQPALRAEFAPSTNVEYYNCTFQGSLGRYWREQRLLPHLIRRSGANVLLSTGNFALWRSPVPQILLSRNALYRSPEFYRDLTDRRDIRLWLDTRVKGSLAKRSLRVADCAIAPTSAFAADLSSWVAKPVRGVHHGFDRDSFFGDGTPLPDRVQAQFEQVKDCIKLLFVSHYNYYRNFETLFRALPLLRHQLAPSKVRLLLTCKLDDAANPGSYRTGKAADLAKSLDIAESVVQLGSVPYPALHHVYRQCDVYVTPAYAESFAHPLVEAMASGLPVVASDIPVHREICGAAARYFSHQSPQALANAVCQALASSQRIAEQRELGYARAYDFSWSKHLDALLGCANELLYPQDACSNACA
jgi:glycosyltransferase involved in cell wall biosynthesis